MGEWWQCAHEMPSNLPGRPAWHDGPHVMRRGEWEEVVPRGQ